MLKLINITPELRPASPATIYNPHVAPSRSSRRPQMTAIWPVPSTLCGKEKSRYARYTATDSLLHSGCLHNNKANQQHIFQHSLTALQSLEGKEKFLHHFILNYMELTKGFTRLLYRMFLLFGMSLSINLLMHLNTR